MLILKYIFLPLKKLTMLENNEKKYPKIEEVLADYCMKIIDELPIVKSDILMGSYENPFPIGKSNLGILLCHKRLSVKQQIKLATFFGLNVEITLKKGSNKIAEAYF